jgi:hypothetical protein
MTSERRSGGRHLGAALAMCLLLVMLLGATQAFALAPAAPHWKLESRPAPTYLPPDGEAMIIVAASNLGDAEAQGTSGQPVTITDTLPQGMEVIEVGGTSRSTPGSEENRAGFKCSAAPVNPVVCTFVGGLAEYEALEIEIRVKTNYEPTAEPENEVTVSGGGAVPSAESRHQKFKVSASKPQFGVESYELTPENEEFQPDYEAGSHPFQLTTTFNLNQTYEPYALQVHSLPSAPALQKKLQFNLPAGLIGNPNAVPQCSDVNFGAEDEKAIDNCPSDTAIGVAAVTINDPIDLFYEDYIVPVFNLVPAPGEPAKFGFEVAHVPIVLDTSVRTGEDYGVNVTIHYASQSVQVLGSRVTFWGVPGDSRHDHARGWACLGRGGWVKGFKPELPCKPLGNAQPAPFLMLPTSCERAPQTAVTGEAWNGRELEEAGLAHTLSDSYQFPTALTGCGELPFDPSIEVTPDKQAASTPTGLTVKVNVPQQSTLEAEGKAEADISSTTLELPVGMQTAAGAATGLETCGVGQAGFGGTGSDTGSVLEKELGEQRFTSAAATCPDAAKIGTVNIKTPLLPKELKGSVYLAQQDTNPFQSPLVLYVVAEEEESKVLVKLAGEVKIDPNTGHIVSRFANSPQTPFETLTLHLFNTERATQATPAFCGGYQAKAYFTTWSGETVTERTTEPFHITSGPNGTPCPGSSLPFGPSFEAGPTNVQAGSFAPFTLNIKRPDGNQALKTIEMHLPPGAAAMLAAVTPCPEPQASKDECGPESHIGHSTALSGLGGKPVSLGGDVYLTGPYRGAPFGILAVTHAKAGPFNLGDIPVRSTITIDPNTAAATITSDALPQIVKGAPAQIKELNVTVDREGFEFNPTNCTPTSVTGTLGGYEGASAAVSTPYQVGNCASLPFTPKLTASVGAQASKANGASLSVKVESSGLGQANIHKVDLTLPLQLPSRLSTIQKACVAAVFEANPATCDEGSNIGYAVIHTPVLGSPLTGPAYLVSHGGAAFPDVEFVLQGEGITLILDGKTDIKKGITYSRFESAPDAPFTTFETFLPTGPHSALTAYVPASKNYSLCGANLTMPTEITAQSGAVIKQTTNIVASGCQGVASFKVTRAQKLAKALKVCRKMKQKSKRAACEKKARKLYGPKKAAKKKTTSKKKK